MFNLTVSGMTLNIEGYEVQGGLPWIVGCDGFCVAVSLLLSLTGVYISAWAFWILVLMPSSLKWLTQKSSHLFFHMLKTQCMPSSRLISLRESDKVCCHVHAVIAFKMSSV